ncbi:MAG: hypothetical protein ABI980_01545 [Nitrospirota bacterium]
MSQQAHGHEEIIRAKAVFAALIAAGLVLAGIAPASPGGEA